MAQQRPDAGRTLQELRQAPSLPTPSPAITPEQQQSVKQQPGGPKVAVQKIQIHGNTVFSNEELLSRLGGAQGNSYDLSGLKNLANRITEFYHANDYPFARAFIPTQSIQNGLLKIEIIEGRYDTAKVTGTNSHVASAQRFLDGLETGSLISGSELERTNLILDDQPGYKFIPIIRPGQLPGTGALTLQMEPEDRFGGSVSADNHGNRYTGRTRGLASLYANSAILFGDQARISSIYTEEDMWFGSAGYSLPVGSSGLRANLGYSHTYYKLGEQFSALNAHGTADVASSGISYPLIRSQKMNLLLDATYQHKWLTDEQDAAGTKDKKNSDALPITLAFDRRDNLLGGGITYGALSWTHGLLDLDNGLAAADSTTARSNGHFDKLNLDISRLQATPVANLVLFGRASGQLAADNLDSSEDFGLGGPNGVRAYPTGEGYGDEGGLAQIEMRYTIDAASPYIFYDYGHVKINHDAWANGNNSRTIAGAGVGMRANYKGITADGSVAWRTLGGSPNSDDKDHVPQIWMNVGYKF